MLTTTTTTEAAVPSLSAAVVEVASSPVPDAKRATQQSTALALPFKPTLALMRQLMLYALYALTLKAAVSNPIAAHIRDYLRKNRIPGTNGPVGMFRSYFGHYV